MIEEETESLKEEVEKWRLKGEMMKEGLKKVLQMKS